MTKLAFLSAAAVLALSTGAQAQTTTASAQPYVGLSGGYHDIGVSDIDGVEDNGAIYGVLAGVDVPVGETLTLGVEGNYHLGTNAIDSEYGVAARIGLPIGATSQLFVKGGYQWVDLDLGNVVGGPVPAGLDDTDGDYLVGVGGEFGVGDGPARIRVGVDTISFDTVRATAGVIFKF
jgi:outer membrane immunogenic protein